MANNFSGDPSCKALWRFESGALTSDSKGTNTLTAVGSPSNGADYKEGLCSIDLESDLGQYLKLLDADADADFPLRAGDATKKITICAWIKPESLLGWQYVIGKTSYLYANRQGVGLGLNGAALYILWGTGATGVDFNISKSLTAGRWYHIALRADGVNKTADVRIWDVTAGTIYTYQCNPASEMGVGSQEFRIGFWNDNQGVKFDGLIDEAVVFNRLLLDAEIDQIRAGTYQGVLFEGSCAAVSTVSGTLQGFILPLEGSLGGIASVTGDLQVIEPTLALEGTIAAASGLSGTLSGFALFLGGTIPVISNLSGTLTGFALHLEGTVTAASGLTGDLTGIAAVLALEGAITAASGLTGDLTGTILPTILHAVTGAGGMKMSGAGAVAYVDPDTLAITGSGGMALGGAGTVEFVAPDTLAIVGDGGFAVGGAGEVSSSPPKEYAHTGTGGFKLGGAGTLEFVSPSDESADLAVVGSGGLALSSASIIDFVTPQVLAVIGSGGFKLGEVRVPELTVVRFIAPADLTLAASTCPVALEMGGEGVVGEFKPGAESVFAVPGPHPADAANLKIGGAGVVAFIHPQILEVIGEGEVYLGGAPATEDESFDTLVLTGARGEPSVYSNFRFNSYACYQRKYYGAGADGIYLLEGDDDAGVEIHAGVRIGPHNFGTDREKRLRLLRCGGECDIAQVKVSDDHGRSGYFDVERGRAGVSRDIQGREITIDISDFESLNHLEIVPLVLAKR